MRVYFHTFGCKANQYDTERMRQEVEARGGRPVTGWAEADVCVVNTCTVTNQADAEARRLVRRLRRENEGVPVVVAGCSAALHGADYARLRGVASVVEGHDPVAVADAVSRAASQAVWHAVPAGGVPAAVDGSARPGGLVRIELRRALDRVHSEPVGAELLRARRGATRGWLKVQDGCDRKCSFCATRLARGASRSRPPDDVVAEARLLAAAHPELVVTGIHIGQYGEDLDGGWTLSRLVALLLERVPDVRLRLGSVEATEVDDSLVELLATSGGRLAPHLHMPLQSGSDRVLRHMRRWHTREMYRSRALEIVRRASPLGLGADVITGFPGETEDDHSATRELIEELPFTYLHVFPFSPRDDTAAAALWRERPVPQRVAGERGRDLRDLARTKGERYRRSREGEEARISLEGDGCLGLTGDYLRVDVRGGGDRDRGRLHEGVLRGHGGHLYIDLSQPSASN
ncbi:MAG TPA: radical SAM protein [Longimicrobiales bacterium]